MNKKEAVSAIEGDGIEMDETVAKRNFRLLMLLATLITSGLTMYWVNRESNLFESLSDMLRATEYSLDYCTVAIFLVTFLVLGAAVYPRLYRRFKPKSNGFQMSELEVNDPELAFRLHVAKVQDWLLMAAFVIFAVATLVNPLVTLLVLISLLFCWLWVGVKETPRGILAIGQIFFAGLKSFLADS